MNKEKEKSKSQQIIENMFINAISKATEGNNGAVINELHVQIDPVAGELQVYDGKETLLEKNIIFEWAERYERGADPMPMAVHTVGVSLAALRKREVFDNPCIGRPFSVFIVDDNFSKTSTALALDGSEAIVSEGGRLMKNLDHELKVFFKDIFKDTGIV
ncbi:MAG: hypothetical protein LBD53_10135 [Tannerella sp.]|jgi:hypothetical protein|nr:hypothetical protein [Tannerella sp.]